jgi:hypothetical protein
LVLIGIFIIATIGGFLGLVLIGMIVCLAVVHGSLSNSTVGWLLGAACVGGVLAGVGMTLISPKLSAANRPAAPKPQNDEIEAPSVVDRIEHGPPGTEYLAIGSRVVVTAVNRGAGGYFSLAFFAGIGAFILFCNWNSTSPHSSVLLKIGMTVFVTVIFALVVGTVLFGSTTIQVQGDDVEVSEGIPGMRSVTSFNRARSIRVAVRRYRSGKSTTTKGVIQDADGAEIAEFGSNLPWKRLCYLKQVVESVVLNRQASG